MRYKCNEIEFDLITLLRIIEEESNSKFRENIQVHLVIIREWPNYADDNTPYVAYNYIYRLLEQPLKTYLNSLILM